MPGGGRLSGVALLEILSALPGTSHSLARSQEHTPSPHPAQSPPGPAGMGNEAGAQDAAPRGDQMGLARRARG
jgi:hypothetical protein